MNRALAPRTLPNGKTYCLELAKTEDAQDDCAGDLEDAFFASEQDKTIARGLFDKIARRLELQRNPCGWWSRNITRRKECQP